MLIPIIVIISLGVLILGHEAGHFFAAKWLKMKVEEFGIGFPPRMFAWMRGGTEYSVNWLPFGGFVKIAGENDRLTGDPEAFETLPETEKQSLFYFRPAWQRSIVLLAGIFMNILLGWLLLSIIFMIGTPRAVIIGEVEKDSPAAVAGLKAGDIPEGFTTAESFTAFTSANRGKEIELKIEREGQDQTFHIMLRSPSSAEQGALGVRLAETGIDRQNPPKALWTGLQATWEMFKGTFLGFLDLIKNLVTHGKVPEGVVGPVGIFGVAKSVGAAGWLPLIQLVALISINLAVLNLLPFPALDGGRFFMVIIEKIKGSPLSKKVEATANGVGFLFLIALMLLITVRDIVHLF